MAASAPDTGFGPALYFLGRRLSAPNLPLSHMVGLGLLALLIPTVPIVTPLLLSAATTVVLMLVATWEAISLRQSPHGKAAAHHWCCGDCPPSIAVSLWSV
ncbi:MAG: hypothetical protein K2Z80_38075 [Xanthobacteraceae bacterium]|nr:hypothetical protein [Xanthobacteraceae bacterium]